MNTLKRMRALFFLLLLVTATLAGCKKETEDFQIEPLTSYYPTTPGKYITYRTDSTVFTSFGTVTTVRSYQEKNEVDMLMTDNLGRPSYRVFRYLRDVDGTQAWKPAGTFFVTLTNHSLEVVENNLRFLKLVNPVKENNSWKGNSFLPFEPYKDKYSFSNDDEGSMPKWDYTYTELNGTFLYKNQPLRDVLTVTHVNESANVPVTQASAYGYINYSLDKYAKGIGLVFQEFIMWEYQPNPGGNNGYKTGFGIKRSMIDHN